MATLDTSPLAQTSDRFDGEARCRLCATARPAAGHDWCPTVSGLVCDECCQHMLFGSLSRLMGAALSGASGTTDVGPLIGACASCERGQRWFAQHVLAMVQPGEQPS